jgi:hypothetical protein
MWRDDGITIILIPLSSSQGWCEDRVICDILPTYIPSSDRPYLEPFLEPPPALGLGSREATPRKCSAACADEIDAVVASMQSVCPHQVVEEPAIRALLRHFKPMAVSAGDTLWKQVGNRMHSAYARTFRSVCFSP